MTDPFDNAEQDVQSEESPDYVGDLRAALEILETEDPYPAIGLVEAVLERHPRLSAAIHVLGLIAYRMDEPGRARELFETAHKIDPNCLETADALAILNARIGNLSESTYYGKLVTALKPHPHVDGLLPEWYGTFAEAFLAVSESRYGKVADRMVRAGDLDGAVEMYRKEAEAHPADPDAQRNFARALLADERPYEALVIYQRLGRFAVLDSSDEAYVANCLSLIGRADEAARIANGIISEGILSAEIASRLVGDIANDPHAAVSNMVEAEIGWANAFMPINPITVGRGALDAGLFKVGFVTGRAHSRGQLECFWPLMSALATRKVAVHVYALRSVEDPIGRRLRGTVASWVDASEVDDDTLCAIIRNDGVHVLIDLDGHSGTGRPRLFLHRPAPVAMRALGLSPSAPAQGFDYVLGDEWLYPDVSEDGAVCSIPGGLFRVPGASVSGQESEEAGLVGPDGEDAADLVTVGVVATRSDLTDQVWSELRKIADGVDNVRFLFSGRRVGGDYGIGEIVEISEGFDLQDRIRFTEDAPSMTARDFVEASDILLQLGGDSWPAALAEAIGIGRPVVACPGSFPHMRASASVLGGLGLSAYVFDTFEAASGKVIELGASDDAREKASETIFNASTSDAFESASQAWAEAFHSAIVIAYRQKMNA